MLFTRDYRNLRRKRGKCVVAVKEQNRERNPQVQVKTKCYHKARQSADTYAWVARENKCKYQDMGALYKLTYPVSTTQTCPACHRVILILNTYEWKSLVNISEIMYSSFYRGTYSANLCTRMETVQQAIWCGVR